MAGEYTVVGRDNYMLDKIAKVSLGIRHRREFRIAETAGSIVDFIAHDKDGKSPFAEGYFTQTQLFTNGPEVQGRSAADETGDNSIVANIDSFIVNIATNSLEETLTRLSQKILPYLTNNIFPEFGIENFNRIGIVYEFKISSDSRIHDTLVQRITDSHFQYGTDFSLRFSSKAAEPRGAVMQELLDYVNSIVTILKVEDSILLKYDYQYYFTPVIKKAVDINFNDFIKESRVRLESDFLSWCSSNEK